MYVQGIMLDGCVFYSYYLQLHSFLPSFDQLLRMYAFHYALLYLRRYVYMYVYVHARMYKYVHVYTDLCIFVYCFFEICWRQSLSYLCNKDLASDRVWPQIGSSLAQGFLLM